MPQVLLYENVFTTQRRTGVASPPPCSPPLLARLTCSPRQHEELGVRAPACRTGRVPSGSVRIPVGRRGLRLALPPGLPSPLCSPPQEGSGSPGTQGSGAAGGGGQLLGAKITGGGSGGTVCILGQAGPAGAAAVESVRQQFKALSGAALDPFVVAGSSPGALEFGHLIVRAR